MNKLIEAMTYKYYYKLLILLVLLISGCNFIKKNKVQLKKNDTVEYSWIQDNEKVALLIDGEVLWQLNFDSNSDKPYFHPLRTVNGHDLTLERPEDHPWHRGLWFSWKFINQINFWEEDPSTGLSDGRSKISQVKIERIPDYSAKINIVINYEHKEVSFLTEHRTLNISAPQNGTYKIEWQHEFQAERDVLLDLVKPAKHGGKEWGGYAGLSYRGSDKLMHHKFRASNGWINSENIIGYGEKAKWMTMNANVKSSPEDLVGITIFQSPSNKISPSPWYVWFAKNEHAFFTPSLLFDQEIHLLKGHKLALDYLVLINTKQESKETLDKIYKNWINYPVIDQ